MDMGNRQRGPPASGSMAQKQADEVPRLETGAVAALFGEAAGGMVQGLDTGF